MYEPGSRIRAESFGTKGNRDRAGTENTCRWTDKADASQQAQSQLFEWIDHMPRNQTPNRLETIVHAVSRAAGPALLLLTVAGIGWVGSDWL